MYSVPSFTSRLRLVLVASSRKDTKEQMEREVPNMATDTPQLILSCGISEAGLLRKGHEDN